MGRHAGRVAGALLGRLAGGGDPERPSPEGVATGGPGSPGTAEGVRTDPPQDSERSERDEGRRRTC
jgi:hypothetical protein